MFGFWAFFIHHIYTAILVSVEEQDGLMDSIFSGYKFVPEHELEDDLAVQELQPDAEPAPATREREKTTA
jgi:Ni/Fe-hydrogenase 1 B-type cytochrome subunit